MRVEHRPGEEGSLLRVTQSWRDGIRALRAPPPPPHPCPGPAARGSEQVQMDFQPLSPLSFSFTPEVSLAELPALPPPAQEALGRRVFSCHRLNQVTPTHGACSFSLDLSMAFRVWFYNTSENIVSHVITTYAFLFLRPTRRHLLNTHYVLSAELSV